MVSAGGHWPVPEPVGGSAAQLGKGQDLFGHLPSLLSGSRSTAQRQVPGTQPGYQGKGC